ncbi:MAG: tripartite tricarboxylate transporter substrate binding protein [Xanthobacteraceae bacterium]|nr:tripartite tricarboxylate transporter substrate binding protein [Xanthobacteraceae bacterium]
MITKSALAALPIGLLVLVLAPAVSAQDYPSRPVEVVVPFPAGGGTEIVTRHVSEGLTKRLGQPFVVLNRPGANTNLGTLAVVRSRPDGHTLLITSFGLAANPSLYSNLGFEPLVDLDPITLVANSPTVLTVPLALPVNSVPEFIAYAKARPGELNYATYGVGSSPHLAAVLFQSMTSTKLVHIPYNGGGPAALGVMTNQVQALFSSAVTVLGMVRSGTLKALAISSERRSELMPSVPTFAEQGLDFRSGTWYGLLAPARTPPAIIGTLHRASAAVLADPGVKAKVIEQGAEVVANSPAEFRAFLKEETDRLRRVIRESHIRLD